MIALISLFKEDRKFEKIHDIFGVIKGSEEPDRYVILGNHRDTWTYGAVDPNSGTASLLDIARRLGIMLQSGWKPRRSIILCSWDAEEFGMVSRYGRNTIRCYWINVRHITKSRPRYTLNIRQLSHVYCLNHICH
jgi:hypothetical protein